MSDVDSEISEISHGWQNVRNSCSPDFSVTECTSADEEIHDIKRKDLSHYIKTVIMDKYLTKSVKKHAINCAAEVNSKMMSKIRPNQIFKKMVFEGDSDEDELVSEFLSKQKKAREQSQNSVPKGKRNSRAKVTPNLSLKRKSNSNMGSIDKYVEKLDSPKKEIAQSEKSESDSEIPLGQTVLKNSPREGDPVNEISSTQLLGKISDASDEELSNYLKTVSPQKSDLQFDIFASEKILDTDEEIEPTKTNPQSPESGRRSISITPSDNDLDDPNVAKIHQLIEEDKKLASSASVDENSVDNDLELIETQETDGITSATYTITKHGPTKSQEITSTQNENQQIRRSSESDSDLSGFEKNESILERDKSNLDNSKSPEKSGHTKTQNNFTSSSENDEEVEKNEKEFLLRRKNTEQKSPKKSKLVYKNAYSSSDEEDDEKTNVHKDIESNSKPLKNISLETRAENLRNTTKNSSSGSDSDFDEKPRFESSPLKTDVHRKNSTDSKSTVYSSTDSETDNNEKPNSQETVQKDNEINKTLKEALQNVNFDSETEFKSTTKVTDSDFKSDDKSFLHRSPQKNVELTKKQSSSSDSEIDSDENKNLNSNSKLVSNSPRKSVESTRRESSSDSESDSDHKPLSSFQKDSKFVPNSRNRANDSISDSDDEPSLGNTQKSFEVNKNLKESDLDQKHSLVKKVGFDSDNDEAEKSQRLLQQISKVNLEESNIAQTKSSEIPNRKKSVSFSLKNNSRQVSKSSPTKSKNILKIEKKEIPRQLETSNFETNVKSDLKERNLSESELVDNSSSREMSTKAVMKREQISPSGSEDDASENEETNQSTIYEKLKTVCDDDSDQENVHFNENVGLIETIDEFKSYHKPLKEINYETTLKLDDINSDDEIFIIQCPKLLDPKELLEQRVTLNRSSTLKLDSATYDWNVHATHGDTISVIGSDRNNNKNQLKLFDLAGMITVSEKLTPPTVNSFPLTTQNDKVEFPVNLKRRHPLFGADYTSNINLSGEVQAKFSEIEKMKQKLIKKQHKRRKSVCESENANSKENDRRYFEYNKFLDNLSKNVTEISEKQENDPQKISKKKRKHSESGEFDEIDRKKPKKIKYENAENDFFAPDSIDMLKRKSFVRKDNTSVDSSIDSGVQLTENECTIAKNQQLDTNEENRDKTKKSKHIINDQISGNLSFSMEDTEIKDRKHKRKRARSVSEPETSKIAEFTPSASETSESVLSDKKLKHKKRKKGKLSADQITEELVLNKTKFESSGISSPKEYKHSREIIPELQPLQTSLHEKYTEKNKSEVSSEYTNEIIEVLPTESVESEKKFKKHKKHKKDKQSNISFNTDEESVLNKTNFESLNNATQISSPKKQKHNKKEQSLEETVPETSNRSEVRSETNEVLPIEGTVEKKSKKHKKHKKDKQELLLNETNFELINDTTQISSPKEHKHKKKKHSNIINDQSLEETVPELENLQSSIEDKINSSKKKHKRKKDKKSECENVTTELEDNLDQLPCTKTHSPVKKKKHKHMEEVERKTETSSECIEFPVSEEYFSKRKKKDKVVNKDEANVLKNSSLIEDSSFVSQKRKKKKHKRHSSDETSLLESESRNLGNLSISPIENSLDVTKKKKHKHKN